MTFASRLIAVTGLFSGGDLPVASVTANECWPTSFARVHYKDTVNYQPAMGEESTCAFGANHLCVL
jgi:hypothetical protein